MAARHFGYSADSVSQWVRAYDVGGVRGLELRRRDAPGGGGEGPAGPEGEAAGAVVRGGDHPLAAKGIDRVIGRLRARGILRKAIQPRKGAVRRQHKRLRRPRELVADSSGALVQVDSKHVALGNVKVVYQFGDVDCFTRKGVVDLAPRLISHQRGVPEEGGTLVDSLFQPTQLPSG